MSIGLITITHNRIGEAILEAAEQIIGSSQIAVRHFPIRPTDRPEDIEQALGRAVEELDQGDGVLILADLFGSTPCNIAHRVGHFDRVRVVAGVNLPMVLRVFNYAHLDLASIAEKAAEGARTGVIQRDPREA